MGKLLRGPEPSVSPLTLGGSGYKESACDAGDLVSFPGSGRSPGEGNGNHPALLPGKPHGQRSLAGYSPRGHTEVDTPE